MVVGTRTADRWVMVPYYTRVQQSWRWALASALSIIHALHQLLHWLTEPPTSATALWIHRDHRVVVVNAVAINIKDLVDASVGSREHEGPQEQKWRTCINNANANITTFACYARCSVWRDWQGMKISAAVEIDNQKFRIKSFLLYFFYSLSLPYTHARQTLTTWHKKCMWTS